MSNWTDCEALALWGEPIDYEVPNDAPPWLTKMLMAAHDFAHDAALLRWPEIVLTCRLWLHGDENRALPMPLRYAAPQPQSAEAILGVLTQRGFIGKGANDGRRRHLHVRRNADRIGRVCDVASQG